MTLSQGVPRSAYSKFSTKSSPDQTARVRIMSGASGLISPASTCFARVDRARFLTRLRKNSSPVPERASMICSRVRSREVRWESAEGELTAVPARFGALLLDDCTNPFGYGVKPTHLDSFLRRREDAETISQ